MPSIAITYPYEAVYIVDPGLGDEQIAAITAKYRGIIETGGGTVDKVDVWERRRLAYEVKGRTEGIYVVMLFRSEPPVEAELRRIFQISEDQIRFLIVRQDEADTAPLAPAASPAASAPQIAAAPAPAPPVVETPPATEPVPVAAPAEPEAAQSEAAPAATEA